VSGKWHPIVFPLAGTQIQVTVRSPVRLYRLQEAKRSVYSRHGPWPSKLLEGSPDCRPPTRVHVAKLGGRVCAPSASLSPKTTKASVDTSLRQVWSGGLLVFGYRRLGDGRA
jgi:hypothetical protein